LPMQQVLVDKIAFEPLPSSTFTYQQRFSNCYAVAKQFNLHATA
jgi:hypothetical protein